MKHVVISIKSLHNLRQITLSSASSYVPCCVKSCTNLYQKACCFASSCNCTLLFLHCHLPFLIFFSDIFRFLFSCFLFFNPRFFQMFFDKVCVEIQSVLLSNVPYIFHNILRYSRISIATRRPKPQGEVLLPASRYIIEYRRISENMSLFDLQ